ncbi:SRPBCC family protein [Agromyces bracchium]|uniref:SRPBCC domain-containing protein n=1 Tax=Agromyces bracchium TaxID=88376 RepID=A0A6I3LX32_9MICO|nr:SRPBCC domain-containing protein [Agromyces bracchium]MTH67100.1 SRPBCC domain-containing protein [Agromyces bracchium]
MTEHAGGTAADTTTETLELRASRTLPATPEEVFDAYTDAEQQKIWFSILDEEPGVVEIEVDLRVGGRQVAVWGPDRDTLFREEQVFLEIDRPHRLVTESTGSDPSGQTLTTHIVVTFEPVDGGTLMSVVQSGFPTPEFRDFFASQAWVGAFDRIEAYLVRR